MSATAIVPAGRASEVLDLMKQAKQNAIKGFFDLGELLSEARRGDYHLQLGYTNFGEFVESQDWLDMKERQAYSVIKIVDNARQLGIGRYELEATKISKLKEIFSLDSRTQGDNIKQLVADSSSMSLEEIQERVSEYKAKDGREPVTHLNLTITRSQKEVIMEAINKARMVYGNTITDTGELVDISDGRAIELVCGSYLASADEIDDEEELIQEEEEEEAA